MSIVVASMTAGRHAAESLYLDSQAGREKQPGMGF